MNILGAVGGHSQGNANIIIWRLFVIARTHTIVWILNPWNCQGKSPPFSGTFVQYLYPKYHNKQVRAFIPQPLRGGLQHPLLRHAFWGGKQFCSLLQHKEECGFHWCCPDHEAPLPHTPSHLIFLCYVCSCSLILILKTLIYIYIWKAKPLKSSWLGLLLEHVHKYVVWIFLWPLTFPYITQTSH